MEGTKESGGWAWDMLSRLADTELADAGTITKDIQNASRLVMGVFSKVDEVERKATSERRPV